VQRSRAGDSQPYQRSNAPCLSSKLSLQQQHRSIEQVLKSLQHLSSEHTGFYAVLSLSGDMQESEEPTVHLQADQLNLGSRHKFKNEHYERYYRSFQHAPIADQDPEGFDRSFQHAPVSDLASGGEPTATALAGLAANCPRHRSWQ